MCMWWISLDLRKLEWIVLHISYTSTFLDADIADVAWTRPPRSLRLRHLISSRYSSYLNPAVGYFTSLSRTLPDAGLDPAYLCETCANPAPSCRARLLTDIVRVRDGHSFWRRSAGELRGVNVQRCLQPCHRTVSGVPSVSMENMLIRNLQRIRLYFCGIWHRWYKQDRIKIWRTLIHTHTHTRTRTHTDTFTPVNRCTSDSH